MSHGYDPDLYGHIDTVRSWEDGQYPTPPTTIDRKFSDSSSSKEPPSLDRDIDNLIDQTDESLIDSFEGLLLSVVPPYKISTSNTDEEVEISSLFLGNEDKWVRVNFWDAAADQVTEYYDADPDTTLKVEGIVSEADTDITDIWIFESNPDSYITETESTVIFRPEKLVTDSIRPDTFLDTAVADVIDSFQDTFTDENKNEFTLRYLALDIDGDRFVANFGGTHVHKSPDIGDTLLIVGGWWKDKERFIHSRLPDISYSGKFRVDNYSGVRNLSQNPLPN